MTQSHWARVRIAAWEPTLVRVGIFIAATAAVLLADPRLSLFLLAAPMPAVMPRSWVPVTFMSGIAVMWLFETHHDPGLLTAWRVGALALAVYYVHTGAALAAVLPYNAVYPRGILTPWLVRVGAVSAATVVIVALVFSIATLSSGSHVTYGATVAGFGLTVATAVFLVYLGKRRR